MKNYILIYKLGDKNSEKELLNQIKNKFPKHREISENNENYFSFAAREIPQVQDELQVILNGLKVYDSDYIALYYTREEEPDEINRLMILGTSSSIDNRTITTNYERILGELLEYDFIKSKNK